MKADNNRLVTAFGVLLIWMALTMALGHASRTAEGELGELVAYGIGWQFVGACLFLAAVVMVFSWNDIGFDPPRPLRSLRLLWLPAIYLGLFLALALVLGLPPATVTGFILLNTLLVGISEETMFRGILFAGLRSKFRIWPAIWITTVIFGAVHVFNVLFTGQLMLAAAQAVAAFMSGTMFMAIRIRTNSLIPVILLHAAWDFLLFLVSWPREGQEMPQEVGGWALLAPVLMVFIPFIYGLYLLRKVGRDKQ